MSEIDGLNLYECRTIADLVLDKPDATIAEKMLARMLQILIAQVEHKPRYPEKGKDQ